MSAPGPPPPAPSVPPAPRPVAPKPVGPPRLPAVGVAGKPLGPPKVGAAAASPAGTLKTAISRFSPVYLFSWQGEQDTCTICRCLFTSPCVNCEVQGKDEPCPEQEGVCGHKFHMHCIDRWRAQDDTCPFCHETWIPK